jgi:hypothetical protein
MKYQRVHTMPGTAKRQQISVATVEVGSILLVCSLETVRTEEKVMGDYSYLMFDR